MVAAPPHHLTTNCIRRPGSSITPPSAAPRDHHGEPRAARATSDQRRTCHHLNHHLQKPRPPAASLHMPQLFARPPVTEHQHRTSIATQQPPDLVRRVLSSAYSQAVRRRKVILSNCAYDADVDANWSVILVGKLIGGYACFSKNSVKG